MISAPPRPRIEGLSTAPEHQKAMPCNSPLTASEPPNSVNCRPFLLVRKQLFFVGLCTLEFPNSLQEPLTPKLLRILSLAPAVFSAQPRAPPIRCSTLPKPVRCLADAGDHLVLRRCDLDPAWVRLQPVISERSLGMRHSGEAVSGPTSQTYQGLPGP